MGDRSGARLKIRIHHLRRKLDHAAPDAVAIQTITGTDYRLKVRPEHPGGGPSAPAID